ncbi:SusC/RagA family TonB-linked outer membrane protein [Flavobacterium magnesitis]|uniref:SusC/RagA family TonB-linked outer membrane protein n=1 Tax=Flavobacterium magnesitis TaxID=3138077 RepID=UPI00358DE595
MKHSFVKYLVFFSIMLTTMTTLAQTNTITGTIKDNSGMPIPGANVLVKNTNNGVQTDFDGKFAIKASSGDILVATFIGMKTIEIKVSNQTNVNFKLEEEGNNLQEVVVVGYGVQKKRDVTGALVSVSSEDIASRPVNNAVEAMQGKAAGIDISSNERPGQVGTIRIRGNRSITGSNSPLYVVDGIPLNSGGIDFINPVDIESIDVLKDASATAIFGSRGANGVIIVTTKKGKSGKFTLNYDTAVTTESIFERAPIMSAGDYIELRRWAKHYETPTVFPKGNAPTIENDRTIFFADGDPTAWANIEKGWAGGTWDGSKLTTTNWAKFVTQTGITRQQTLSVSGGTEKMKAYGSFGYINNTGTLKGQGFKRYTGIANIDITPTKWFSMGANLNVSYGETEFGQSTVGRSAVATSAGIYNTARQNLPYAFPLDADGNRIQNPGADSTIRNVLDEHKLSQDQRLTLRAFGSFYAQLDFGGLTPALTGLKYRVNFGPDLTSFRNGVFLDGQSSARSGTNFASLNKEQIISYTLDNLIFYNKTLGKHDFGLTLLQSKTQYAEESSAMSAQNIPITQSKWNALTPVNVGLLGYSSNFFETGLFSYMGRINYGFDDKYLLTASLRYDAASQLAEGNKGAYFPSASIGWRIDKENFLQDISWLNQLKLRVGFGVVGNAAVPAFETQPPLAQVLYSTFSGVNNNAKLGNIALGWERTTQYNYGIDFGIFKNRISGSLEYYTSQTNDLLLARTIPSVSGFTNTTANIGQTESEGIELTLNTVNVRTKDFEWSSSLSASWQQNAITELQNGKFDDIVNNRFIGRPQGVIYGFESNGIWRPEDAVEMQKFNDAAGRTVFTFGNARPVDQNGDYLIDPNNDRVIIGNTEPKFITGLTNTFNYKNIELSIFVYGRMGYLFDVGGENLSGKTSQRVIDYYTDDNTDAEYQKPIFSAGTGDVYNGTLGYRNGSFLKIRNISLGYNFDEDTLEKIGISRLRFYLQATNPGMIFSKVDFIDLDTGTSFSNRGFTLGLNIQF